MINIQALLSHPMVRAHIERALAARGINGDDHIVHVNDQEEAMLRAAGGSGTINPKTGLRQFDPAGIGGGVGGGLSGGAASDGPTGAPGQGGQGGGIGGFIGGIVRGLADNFGQGYGSLGVAGGYGRASNPSSYGGRSGGDGPNNNGQQVASGGGAGGSGIGGGVSSSPVTLPQAPPADIATSPLMSQTPAANLIGSRFGALPAWATQSYQLGTQPTSYPVGGQPFATTGMDTSGGMGGGAGDSSSVAPVGGSAPGSAAQGPPIGGNGGVSQLNAIGGMQTPQGSLNPALGNNAAINASQLLTNFFNNLPWNNVGATTKPGGFSAAKPTTAAAKAASAPAAPKPPITSQGAAPAHPQAPAVAGKLTTAMIPAKPAAKPKLGAGGTVGRGSARN